MVYNETDAVCTHHTASVSLLRVIPRNEPLVFAAILGVGLFNQFTRLGVDQELIVIYRITFIIGIAGDITQLAGYFLHIQTVKLITNHLIDTLDSNGIVSVGDGTDAAIAALPYMIHLHRDTKSLQDPAILLFALLMHHGQVRRWTILSFRNLLWQLNSDMAKRLVFAYIRLYPEFKELKKFPHKKTTKACVEAYLDQIGEDLSGLPGEVSSIDQLDETAQLVATLLLPVDSHAMLSNIVLTVGQTIWPVLFARSHYQDGDAVKDNDLLYDYIEWLALTLLLSSPDLRSKLCLGLFPCLGESRNTESLLIQLIQQQDRVCQKAAFWYVWEKLLTPIGKIISTGSRYGSADTPYAAYFSGLADGIITTYLFAWNRWTENCKEWHTIDQNNAAFFPA